MTRPRVSNPFIMAWLTIVLLTMLAPMAAIAAGYDPFTGSSIEAVEAGEGEAGAHEEETFSPVNEFALERIGPELMIGPIDMSINKVVLSLLLAFVVCCGFAVWQARKMALKPSGTQTFVETLYEFTHDIIAKATLGPRVFNRYMPYVASLFMFIWVVNLISFIPLPFGHGGALQFYAATSNLNVTLALTLVTFGLTHYEGIRNNGTGKYFKSWAPSGIEGGGKYLLVPFIWGLHALSELLRLISLSVRLFANMLAGHMLIAVLLSIVIIVGSVAALAITPLTVGFATAFYLFEVGLVATLQAFIFALLSGLYIGGAAEPHH